MCARRPCARRRGAETSSPLARSSYRRCATGTHGRATHAAQGQCLAAACPRCAPRLAHAAGAQRARRRGEVWRDGASLAGASGRGGPGLNATEVATRAFYQHATLRRHRRRGGIRCALCDGPHRVAACAVRRRVATQLASASGRECKNAREQTKRNCVTDARTPQIALRSPPAAGRLHQSVQHEYPNRRRPRSTTPSAESRAGPAQTASSSPWAARVPAPHLAPRHRPASGHPASASTVKRSDARRASAKRAG